MSLETEVKSIIGVRPISYFKVEGACSYDDLDPSNVSRQQVFADAYSMAMVDYFHKGQSTPFAEDVLVAVLLRLTNKHERTELVHVRVLSDAYFASPTIKQFTENVVLPNTKRLTHVCRKLMPDADIEKCEAVVFETTQAEFCKILRSVGGSNTNEPTLVKDIVLSEVPTLHHISVKNRRLNLDGSPIDAAVTEFVFRYNLKVDGLSDEEIDAQWKQSPWYKG